MARECSVCRHPKSEEINDKITSGVHSDGEIADMYGFSRRVINYHKNNHLLKDLSKNAIKSYVSDSGGITSLADKMNEVEAMVFEIHKKAMESGQNSLALQSAKELRGQLETATKVASEMRQQEEQRNQKNWRAEWEVVRVMLDDVFHKYPDAGDLFDRKLLSSGFETFTVSI